MFISMFYIRIASWMTIASWTVSHMNAVCLCWSRLHALTAKLEKSAGEFITARKRLEEIVVSLNISFGEGMELQRSTTC